MRTAYAPKSHIELASESAGNAYGHVPGHQYLDVDVVISRSRKDSYRCHVVESHGSAQGYDEEHGRTEVIGRGDSIDEAVANAKQEAVDADIDREKLAQALSLAADAAHEFEDDEEDADDE